MTTSENGGRWVVLLHQLPAIPSGVRVTIWRRLQQLGALPLRNSVYVLPNSAEAREDFEWLRAEIAGLGGSATVMAADMVNAHTSDELEEQFREQCRRDYADLMRGARKQLERWRAAKRAIPRAVIRRHAQAFRERYTRIRAADHFNVEIGARAADAVREVEDAAAPQRAKPAASPTAAKRYRGKTWVTRTRPGVDRMACAWFIRRFVDAKARFSFVASDARVPSGRVPFDMYGVEFGHHGSHCSLETLIEAFAVRDAATLRLSQVVHDLDLKDGKYGLPESAAIGRVIEGLRQIYADDGELLRHGMVLMEALCRSFTGDRPAKEPRRGRPSTRRRRPRAGRE